MYNNRDIPQEFHTLLDSDESFVWVGKPKSFPYIITGIPFLLIGLVWGALDFGFIQHAGKGNNDFPLIFAIPFFALHLFPFYGSILNMFRLHYVANKICYAFTNKRVLIKGGLFGSSLQSIPYHQIVTVELNSMPWNTIAGCGTLTIQLPAFVNSFNNMRRSGVSLSAIEQPLETYKMLNDLISNSKEQSQEKSSS